MKVKVVQIVWHSKEPVFSVDFHPSGLLASGGGDKDIKVCVINAARRNKHATSINPANNISSTSAILATVLGGEPSRSYLYLHQPRSFYGLTSCTCCCHLTKRHIPRTTIALQCRSMCGVTLCRSAKTTMAIPT